jgi:hypothetical protein
LKHVSFFLSILLTLTLTINWAYATSITVGTYPEAMAFDSHLNEIFVSSYNSPGTVSVLSG